MFGVLIDHPVRRDSLAGATNTGGAFLFALCAPMVPAVLTHKLGMLRLLDLLTLSTEYFYEQRRQGKHDPLDRQPPPADKAPPQASAVLGNELRRCYQLRGYTIASALRASVYASVTV